MQGPNLRVSERRICHAIVEEDCPSLVAVNYFRRFRYKCGRTLSFQWQTSSPHDRWSDSYGNHDDHHHHDDDHGAADRYHHSDEHCQRPVDTAWLRAFATRLR
jgi:hypothetical protein